MVNSIRIALFVTTVCAQTKYGENHVKVNLDSQLVEQTAFPTPNETLYSPAFLANATSAPGWVEGTEGATSQDQLGMSICVPTRSKLMCDVESFLSDLAAKNTAWMSFEKADFLSEEGKTFPYVKLSTASGNHTSSDKLRVCGLLHIWFKRRAVRNRYANDLVRCISVIFCVIRLKNCYVSVKACFYPD